MPSQRFAELFHALFTSAYIMFILTLVNKDIMNIEKSDGICSPTFFVDEFSGLFVLISINLFYEMIKIFRRHFNTTKIFIFTYFFYVIQVCFLLYRNEDNSGNKNHIFCCNIMASLSVWKY